MLSRDETWRGLREAALVARCFSCGDLRQGNPWHARRKGALVVVASGDGSTRRRNGQASGLGETGPKTGLGSLTYYRRPDWYLSMCQLVVYGLGAARYLPSRACAIAAADCVTLIHHMLHFMPPTRVYFRG